MKMVKFLYELIGWTGTILIILAYYLVSKGVVAGTDFVYQIINLLGAFLLGINVFIKRAWPALGLQIVWAIIAIWAIANMFF